MDLLATLNLFLTLYGPLSLGWFAAVALCMGMWRMHQNHRKELSAMYREHISDLTRITESVTRALQENTRATAALTTRVGDWVLRRPE